MSARAKCTLDVYVSDWREVRDLTEASVKDVRSNLREYLDRAEAGEEIVVTRREPGNFPDLTEFRHSTELESDGPLEALLKIREETRY